jgi:hypothetical protein
MTRRLGRSNLGLFLASLLASNPCWAKNHVCAELQQLIDSPDYRDLATEEAQFTQFGRQLFRKRAKAKSVLTGFHNCTVTEWDGPNDVTRRYECETEDYGGAGSIDVALVNAVAAQFRPCLAEWKEELKRQTFSFTKGSLRISFGRMGSRESGQLREFISFSIGKIIHKRT